MSLQAHEDKIKRRHEEPLEQVIKLNIYLKDDGSEKSQKKKKDQKKEDGCVHSHGQLGRGRCN